MLQIMWRSSSLINVFIPYQYYPKDKSLRKITNFDSYTTAYSTAQFSNKETLEKLQKHFAQNSFSRLAKG